MSVTVKKITSKEAVENIEQFSAVPEKVLASQINDMLGLPVRGIKTDEFIKKLKELSTTAEFISNEQLSEMIEKNNLNDKIKNIRQEPSKKLKNK